MTLLFNRSFRFQLLPRTGKLDDEGRRTIIIRHLEVGSPASEMQWFEYQSDLTVAPPPEWSARCKRRTACWNRRGPYHLKKVPKVAEAFPRTSAVSIFGTRVLPTFTFPKPRNVAESSTPSPVPVRLMTWLPEVSLRFSVPLRVPLWFGVKVTSIEHCPGPSLRSGAGVGRNRILRAVSSDLH